MSPSAAATIDNYLEYANAVVQVLFPPYFYKAWVASRLVPANKVPIEDLPPGTIPDCSPVNIGSSERRFITRAYFDDALVTSYTEILGPIQNGVGIKNGISITAFAVQSTLDAAPAFAAIKGDMKNGYNEIK